MMAENIFSKSNRSYLNYFIPLLMLVICSCKNNQTNADITTESFYTGFSDPIRVTVNGYSGDLMEPFITRDNRYLFFNNLNDPSVNTNLYYAERVDDTTFTYIGEINGVNSQALDGVASMDTSGRFFFVTTRSYDTTLSTIYQGSFTNGTVSDISLAAGISRLQPSWINFDVEVSTDGQTLYYVDSKYRPTGTTAADIVIAHRNGNVFEQLSNSYTIMAVVNSDAIEYAACISQNELELFFNRAAAPLSSSSIPSIYRATRNSTAEPFANIEKVSAISGFAEGATITSDSKRLYFHKMDSTAFHIYMVRR
jgi:hypothetical protein